MFPDHRIMGRCFAEHRLPQDIHENGEDWCHRLHSVPFHGTTKQFRGHAVIRFGTFPRPGLMFWLAPVRPDAPVPALVDGRAS